MVRDPLKPWTKLREQYDHMKTIVVLPQAQYVWQHLKLQDYKSVADYNSTLYNIVTQLELCGVKISEAQMLEKTFPHFMLPISSCNNNTGREILLSTHS